MVVSKSLLLRRPSVRKLNGRARKQVTNLHLSALDALESCQTAGVLRTAADGPYRNQYWARDLSLLSLVNPELALQVIELFLEHQRPDGALPHRIEGNRHTFTYLVGRFEKVAPWLVQRRKPEPIYRDTWLAVPALDTVPVIILAFFQVYMALEKSEPARAKELLDRHYPQLLRAMHNDDSYRDSHDLLYRAPPVCDWMDDLKRRGKLCLINVLYCQAHRSLAAMAHKVGDPLAAHHYSVARAMRASIRRVFWDAKRGFFKAGIDDPRLDVPANVFASLYLATRDEATRIQEAIDKLTLPSGLVRTFDAHYPWWTVRLHYACIGFGKFASVHMYPWIAHFTVLTRLRLAQRLLASKELKDKRKGAWHLQKARKHFLALGVIHQATEGFCEVLDHEHRPAKFDLGLWHYRTSRRFAGTFLTYLAVHTKLKELGMLPS